MVQGICDGRVVIVTGAGQGIGRAHALEFARQGARVVVNDYDSGAAGDVAREAAALAGPSGGALALAADVSDYRACEQLVRGAVDQWGTVDTVVNNAGVVRDRMVTTMSPAEWDAVMAVHLRGTFALTRLCAGLWREQAKQGDPVRGRIVNTSSGAGLFGSVGQANYAAAKAGIATFTIVAAAELKRYGVTVNAIAPSARTQMTETVFADMMAKPAEGFDRMDPANIAPLVVWLGSDVSGHVTGRVFEVEGGRLCVALGWTRGPEVDKGDRWAPAEIGAAVDDLLAKAPPAVPVYGAQ